MSLYKIIPVGSGDISVEVTDLHQYNAILTSLFSISMISFVQDSTYLRLYSSISAYGIWDSTP